MGGRARLYSVPQLALNVLHSNGPMDLSRVVFIIRHTCRSDFLGVFGHGSSNQKLDYALCTRKYTYANAIVLRLSLEIGYSDFEFVMLFLVMTELLIK